VWITGNCDINNELLWSEILTIKLSAFKKLLQCELLVTVLSATEGRDWGGCESWISESGSYFLVVNYCRTRNMPPLLLDSPHWRRCVPHHARVTHFCPLWLLLAKNLYSNQQLNLFIVCTKGFSVFQPSSVFNKQSTACSTHAPYASMDTQVRLETWIIIC
jgi:hypothetical protein